MFVKIHTPHSLPGGDNKGSSIRLVEYLEKENKGKIEQELFFNHQKDAINKDDVISKIDNNNKNLGRKDNKFFMLTINPSQNELKHLVQNTTGKEVSSFEELSKEERKKVLGELKNYSREVMDAYAGNFGRDDIKCGENLLYFAKVETSRSYKHFDKLVVENKTVDFNIEKIKNELRAALQSSDLSPDKNEKVKELENNLRSLKSQYHRQGTDIIRTGLKKEGLQLHAHVIVSRNDVLQKTKLSPLSKSKGGTQKLNGKDVMQGFCHEKFKQQASDLFNSRYQYTALVNEQYFSKIQQSVNVGEASSNLVVQKATNTIKNEMLGDLGLERKVFNQAKDIGKAILNPATIPTKAVSVATRKLLEIIKVAASSSGI